MIYNENVPLSLGITSKRAEQIQTVVRTIVWANHSEEERLQSIRATFTLSEECIYAVYILPTVKNDITDAEVTSEMEGV